jgi:hypothetical protein
VTKSRVRTIVILVVTLIAGVIVVNLLAAGLDRAVEGNQPGGVTDSSYATGGDGLAAYASLLTHYDYSVSQQRGAIASSPPDPDATFMLFEPSVVTHDDEAALLEFVTNGGRLVVGGRDPFYLGGLRDNPPEWTSDGRNVWFATDTSFGNVRSVAAAGVGAWDKPGSSHVVIGSNDRSLLNEERVGQGTILYLADVSPLQNDYLDQADNAALGLALAGPTNRPVVFAEGSHGYGNERGLAAIPTRWKWALGVFALAALAFIWSRARRFGPPDRPARDLPPARAEYVRSLSTTLERTHNRPGSFAPVQRWTRDRISARAGLAPDANDEAIAAAAKSLGCSDAEVRAVLNPTMNDDEALALGRVVARVGKQ